MPVFAPLDRRNGCLRSPSSLPFRQQKVEISRRFRGHLGGRDCDKIDRRNACLRSSKSIDAMSFFAHPVFTPRRSWIDAMPVFAPLSSLPFFAHPVFTPRRSWIDAMSSLPVFAPHRPGPASSAPRRPGRAEVAARKKSCPVSLAVVIELLRREGGRGERSACPGVG
jgi:hypothetical protein